MLFKIRSKHYPTQSLRCNDEWSDDMRSSIVTMIGAAQNEARENGCVFQVFSGHSTIAHVKPNGEIAWSDYHPDIKYDWIKEQEEMRLTEPEESL